MIQEFKDLVLKEKGFPFPQEVNEQLERAIRAVFDSWNNQRAIVYRRINKIPDDLGTAVNIQCMAFALTWDRTAERELLSPATLPRTETPYGRIPGQRPGRRCVGRNSHPHAD